jgi:Amt family ammonium transporter
VIKQTFGLRVDETEELAGLDISSHGMYGYPESFIPPEEYPGGPASVGLPNPAGATTAATATAMIADPPPSDKPRL